MYTLAGPLSDVDVAPGSNLLVLGPAMSGKKRLAFEILAAGSTQGDGAIIVSTKDGTDRLIDRYAEVLGDDPADVPIGIVDCVSRQQGVDDVEETDLVKYPSAPDDMTGIGISLSELLEEFHGERNLERNRVCLDSISTLLMYSDVQTIFRFLHVFTGRIQNVDGLGLYLMDPTAHEPQTLNTIKGLFDGVIERPDEDADFAFRGAEL
ncbi:MAG: RAD55 family ATPase [Halobacteriales archaeon]